MHENMFRHEYGAVSPMTRLSDVSSGGESPIMHAGKSKIGMLEMDTDIVNSLNGRQICFASRLHILGANVAQEVLVEELQH